MYPYLYFLSVLNSVDCYISLTKILITWIFASKNSLTPNAPYVGRNYVSGFPCKIEDFFVLVFPLQFAQIINFTFQVSHIPPSRLNLILTLICLCTLRLTKKLWWGLSVPPTKIFHRAKSIFVLILYIFYTLLVRKSVQFFFFNLAIRDHAIYCTSVAGMLKLCCTQFAIG